MSDENENAGHDELLERVARGTAAILSDDNEPGGRFQVAAVVMGGEFVLTNWHQDAKGDWRSARGVWLKHDAATRLIALLHSAGYAKPITPVT